MGEIRVALAGVGNLSSSLVQGTFYYKKESIGLMHPDLGGYRPEHIKFCAAFDISREKVGKDLSEAIFSKPNNAPKITNIPKTRVIVKMGPSPDNSGKDAMTSIEKADAEQVDVASELKRSKTDLMVNLISGGSDKASKLYAKAALEAGCGFINATPSSIASDQAWAKNYKSEGLPVAGDDLLDQIGATALHKGILEFLNSRGVRLDESYQLDVGGGTESINTLEKTKDIKRSIKTAAVTGSVPYQFPLVSGSTDFVDFLDNKRDSFFWVKGRYYGGAAFTLDLKLSSVDAPNGGSILLDAIRALKVAKDKGLKGVVNPICSYAFKRAERKSLEEAHREFMELVG